MSNSKAGKYACFEFERKFLLKELPRELFNSQNYKIIEDKYFKGTNLRLRTVMSPDGEVLDRKLTQKFSTENENLSKTAITNLYLKKAEADLLDQLSGFILRKKRFKFERGGTIFTIDEFESQPLVIAEIEFESEEEMTRFNIMFEDWKEVTHDPHYSGGHLAQK